jgi:hypothetical protein
MRDALSERVRSDHDCCFASAHLSATRKSGSPVPAPRSYEDIRADEAWALDRGIDWSTSVVSLLQVN